MSGMSNHQMDLHTVSGFFNWTETEEKIGFSFFFFFRSCVVWSDWSVDCGRTQGDKDGGGALTALVFILRCYSSDDVWASPRCSHSDVHCRSTLITHSSQLEAAVKWSESVWVFCFFLTKCNLRKLQQCCAEVLTVLRTWVCDWGAVSQWRLGPKLYVQYMSKDYMAVVFNLVVVSPRGVTWSWNVVTLNV